jgi:hypothetical protein
MTVFVKIKVIHTDDFGIPCSPEHASHEQRRVVSVHSTHPGETPGHEVETHVVQE